jgi:hypothetical protein
MQGRADGGTEAGVCSARISAPSTPVLGCFDALLVFVFSHEML